VRWLVWEGVSELLRHPACRGALGHVERSIHAG
jgi:hypothetical protein